MWGRCNLNLTFINDFIYKIFWLLLGSSGVELWKSWLVNISGPVNAIIMVRKKETIVSHPSYVMCYSLTTQL